MGDAGAVITNNKELINEELSDQILVSVIASDFTEEFDFTHVPTYDHPLPKEENVENDVESVEFSAEESPSEQEDEKESFLKR